MLKNGLQRNTPVPSYPNTVATNPNNLLSDTDTQHAQNYNWEEKKGFYDF